MADDGEPEDVANLNEEKSCASATFGSTSDSSQVTAYIPIRVLGRGAFGEAVLYRKVEDNTLVVWKEIDLKRLSDKEKRESQNEIDILSVLNHPNVISYYNHFLDGTTLLIEMEYANGGCLHKKISAQKELFAEEVIIWYFHQLISAIAYIHSSDILHRDIKTLNIFLTKNGLVKLGDFGISKMLNATSQMAESYVGTPYYMSPELIKGELYDQKSDVWACGCVLYELLTLSRVFDATNPLRLASDIVTAEIEEISTCYSESMRIMLHDMLHKDPVKRPSAEQLLSYPVLSCVSENLTKKVLELNSCSRPLRPSSDVSEVIPVVTSKTSEVFCWGGGKLFPQKLDQFVKGRSALQVSAGSSHFAVVTVEKELYTWASLHGTTMMTGQLGHGDRAAYKSPKKVDAFEGIAVKQASCGDDFSICLTDEGTLYSFGSNYYGCLGCNDGNDAYSPVALNAFGAEAVAQVSCGAAHVIVLTSLGSVYSWGCGEFGRLGLGSEDDFSSPQLVAMSSKQGIRSVHAGPETSFLVTVNGRVLACGSNEHNKLGFNNAVRGVSKQQISYDIPCQLSFTSVKPLSKYHIVAVSSGRTHTAVIDWIGFLITFGSNRFGQLGLGDFRVHGSINVVGGSLAGKRVVRVACGDRYTVASTADNMIYSWGLAEDGRLGSPFSPDQGRGPNGQCFSFPRPIFGSLHVVSDVSCSHWNTIMVAEKVLAQKTIRSGSSFFECKATSQMSLVSETESNSTFEDGYFASESSAALSSFTNTDADSSVPDWLKAELAEAEFIPATPDGSDNKQPTIANEPTVVDGYADVLHSDPLIHNSTGSSDDLSALRERVKALEKENAKLQLQLEEQSAITEAQARTILEMQLRLDEADVLGKIKQQTHLDSQKGQDNDDRIMHK